MPLDPGIRAGFWLADQAARLLTGFGAMAGRTIDVRNQRNLALRRTVGLCFKGITHRLLRSVLTLAVVALAVAFFMFLLSESAFLAAVADGVRQESDTHRFAADLLNRLYGGTSPSAVIPRLAAAWPDDRERLDEAARVLGWEPARVDQLAGMSVREADALRFFDRMTPGRRVILVQKHKGRDILRYLAASNEARTAFRAALREMPDLQCPGGIDGFEAFLAGYSGYEAESAALVADWSAALARLHAATQALTGGRPLEDWLAGAPPEAWAAWGAVVRAQGFALPESRLATVRDQVATAVRRQAIIQTLNTAAKQNQWRTVFQERRMSIEDKLLQLDDARAVALLDGVYTRADLVSVAHLAARERRLAGLEQCLAGKVDARRGHRMGGRQLFLLLISFVVCMVGIANAMLMSITERFREIATMKCLGATDNFIMTQFMLEAGLQGVAGGLLGMGVGFLAALLKSLLLYGGYAVAYWPGLGLAGAAGISLAAGVLLAVLASIYPSWTASRMAPMEAMRVE